MSAPDRTREPTLYARTFAALAVSAIAGLHTPPVHAARPKPVVAPLEAPPTAQPLPAWLQPSRHTERAVAAAQAVQLAAVTQAPPPRAERRGRPPLPRPVEAYDAGNTSAVVAFAVDQVGEAYRLGATGPSVWDCSGLTMAAWARAGVRLPHNAAQQQRYGRAVSRDQLRPGDLVFWGSPAYHVALYVGDGEVVAATKPATGVRRQRIWGSPSAYRRLVG